MIDVCLHSRKKTNTFFSKQLINCLLDDCRSIGYRSQPFADFQKIHFADIRSLGLQKVAVFQSRLANNPAWAMDNTPAESEYK